MPRAVSVDPEGVIPLVADIAEPSQDSIVQAHRGAVAFHRTFEQPFVIKNADFIALLMSLVALIYSAYVQIKNLRANDQIKALMDCLQSPNGQPKVYEYPDAAKGGSAIQRSNYLKDELKKLFSKHRKLDASFQRASATLDHGSFRAFSEAYKSAREIVEREIEDKQRKFSSLYVNEVVNLLRRANSGAEDFTDLSNRQCPFSSLVGDETLSLDLHDR